jgi:hypothetical protein
MRLREVLHNGKLSDQDQGTQTEEFSGLLNRSKYFMFEIPFFVISGELWVLA